MPHFFINSENINNNRITINDTENYRHIAKSLRAKKGEKLLLVDENQIQYETVIEQITTREITVKIENYYKSDRSLDFRLHLAQSPLRSGAQSFIIEKATELGAEVVYPVLTDNCSLNESVIRKKIAKWQNIMYEASKQCERAQVPVCAEMTTLDEIIHRKGFDKIIAFCERNAHKNLRDFCKENPIKKNENVLVIIGPEGGFSEQEFELFEKNNIPMLTLGKLILKAETATTVALGNIIYEYSADKQN